MNRKPISDSGKRYRTLKKLHDAMKSGDVKFSYLKNDGTVRKAHGTLNNSMIPKSKRDDSRESDTPDGCMTYYDITKRGWRTFVKKNLIGIQDNVNESENANPVYERFMSYVNAAIDIIDELEMIYERNRGFVYSWDDVMEKMESTYVKPDGTSDAFMGKVVSRAFSIKGTNNLKGFVENMDKKYKEKIHKRFYGR